MLVASYFTGFMQFIITLITVTVPPPILISFIASLASLLMRNYGPIMWNGLAAVVQFLLNVYDEIHEVFEETWTGDGESEETLTPDSDDDDDDYNGNDDDDGNGNVRVKREPDSGDQWVTSKFTRNGARY